MLCVHLKCLHNSEARTRKNEEMRKEMEGRKVEEKARGARSDEEGRTPSHLNHGEL